VTFEPRSGPRRQPSPVVDAREGGRDGSSRVDLSRSAAKVVRGGHVSIPLWIVLPVLTPLGVIAAAVALQHVERVVLPPSRTVNPDVGLVGDLPHPGVSGDR
jgi:hypothetical protein